MTVRYDYYNKSFFNKKHYEDEFERDSLLNAGVDIEDICTKPDKYIKSLKLKVKRPKYGKNRKYKSVNKK